ncbi:HalOD1 output domain-containing protein [Halorubrum halophilum]|uniref:HalOD1 output domain-containing protein n=1 Tax=Halorubrum halophilum TaxID=413816 RepID=UPI0006796CE7|nr:HalOD1 output domain-containing protein [Halorubrum halophilum]
MTFDNANSTKDVQTGESSETGESPRTVRAAWDDSGPPSTAVVEAVATANGRDPLEMPCLYDTLDVDALDGLLTSDRTDAQGNISVSFTYDGTFVWVDSGGAIEVGPDATSEVDPDATSPE